jgi:pimeloyl-ACP methyl ester carboxylesterase
MGAHTRNPVDGARIYYEDNGGTGPPVIFTYGYMDPIPAARALPLARDLSGSCRLIFVDHRGHGRSDCPRRPEDYALPLRVADIVAVLDALSIEKAHYIGVSWGGRLGFAAAEYAPGRFWSLVLIANQPYAWDPAWPVVQGLSGGIAAMQEGGIAAMLRWFEEYAGYALADPERAWLLDNDPLALAAAWHAALAEGRVSSDIGRWTTPMLIVAGELDDMYENARQASAEISSAQFISLADQDHLASCYESRRILPAIERIWEQTGS